MMSCSPISIFIIHQFFQDAVLLLGLSLYIFTDIYFTELLFFAQFVCI